MPTVIFVGYTEKERRKLRSSALELVSGYVQQMVIYSGVVVLTGAAGDGKFVNKETERGFICDGRHTAVLRDLSDLGFPLPRSS